ncbi:MAG: NAD-dependent epimerase/dehydratase family protein, partial [bacterium]
MILVTGGEGFIGRHVCSVLSAHGKEVIVVDLNIPRGMITKRPYISLKCDIRDKNQLEKIFQ